MINKCNDNISSCQLYAVRAKIDPEKEEAAKKNKTKQETYKLWWHRVVKQVCEY